MSPRTAEAKLDALYAELPTLECRGLCAESCGPIGMSPLEWRRMGLPKPYAPILIGPDLTCPLLKDERCSVYSVRPTICRLWGLVTSMPCEWGCTPSRYLSDAEGRRFLERAEQISATGTRP